MYHPSLNRSENENARKNLDTLEVSYDVLSGNEINRRFALFSLPPFVTGLYEHGAGMLVAGKCVLAFQVKSFVSDPLPYFVTMCDNRIKYSNGVLIIFLLLRLLLFISQKTLQ